MLFVEVLERSSGMKHMERFATERKCPLPRWYQAELWQDRGACVTYIIACVGFERVKDEGMMWHLSVSASLLPAPLNVGGLPVYNGWAMDAGRQLLPGVNLEIDRKESKLHCVHAFGRPVER